MHKATSLGVTALSGYKTQFYILGPKPGKISVVVFLWMQWGDF